MRLDYAILAVIAASAAPVMIAAQGCTGQIADQTVKADAQDEDVLDRADSTDGEPTRSCSPGFDCLRGEYCGYSTVDGCGSTGHCYPRLDASCNIVLGAYCACGGGGFASLACAPFPAGPVLPDGATCAPDTDGGPLDH